MGTEHIKSTQVTNLDASPPVKTSPAESGSRLRVKTASVTVVGDAAATSTYRFFRVRSSDRIVSLRLYNTAMANLTAVDFGLYHINGGAVVTTASGGGFDLYGDGVNLVTIVPAVPPVSATAGDGREMRFADATTAPLTSINNMVWEDINVGGSDVLTADPGLQYDVTATIQAVGGTVVTGTMALRMEYSAP